MAGDLGMEPVSSSLAGAWFALLLIFRSAITLNTAITASRMLSRVWRPELSQGATTFRILTTPKRERSYFVPRQNTGILRRYRLRDC